MAEAAPTARLAHPLILQQMHQHAERDRQRRDGVLHVRLQFTRSETSAVTSTKSTASRSASSDMLSLEVRPSAISAAHRVSSVAREDVDECRSGRPAGIEPSEAWDHLQQQVLADVCAFAGREVQIAGDAARVHVSTAVRIRGR